MSLKGEKSFDIPVKIFNTKTSVMLDDDGNFTTDFEGRDKSFVSKKQQFDDNEKQNQPLQNKNFNKINKDRNTNLKLMVLWIGAFGVVFLLIVGWGLNVFNKDFLEIKDVKTNAVTSADYRKQLDSIFEKVDDFMKADNSVISNEGLASTENTENVGDLNSAFEIIK